MFVNMNTIRLGIQRPRNMHGRGIGELKKGVRSSFGNSDFRRTIYRGFLLNNYKLVP